MHYYRYIDLSMEGKYYLGISKWFHIDDECHLCMYTALYFILSVNSTQ